MNHLWPWIGLVGYVLVLLFIDFFVLHKKGGVPTSKKALGESAFFLINALVFGGVVYYVYQHGLLNNFNQLEASEALVKYLTGYLIELSLSVDNLFVIAMIFASFKIPSQYQHKLLFMGILGALVFRALLIGAGLVLIDKVQGMSIVFGLFLLYTAFKMLKKEANHEQTEEPKGLMRYIRFSKEHHEGKFFAIINGKRVMTAMMGALITIEFTDLLFALDSIPAIFAVTTDSFIVYSSNIFAILGLRSLYFFLASMLDRFVYLKYSVFAILLFVALKLMTATLLHLPEWFSLLFIGLALSIGVIVSGRSAK